MKFLRSHRQFISALMMMFMFSWQVGQPLAAATLYWDADAAVADNNLATGAGLGGSGIWDTIQPNWWNGNVTDAPTTFTSGDTAVFTGLGGTVLLGAPITLGSITFSQNLGASGFNLMGDGTAGSNSLTLAGTAAIAVNVAGTDTISAVIAGSNGLNYSSTTTGTLILTGANTYSGTTTISSGTLSIFADGNLGNAANDITFNGSTAAGLILNVPVVLGAGRTITLNNTGGAVALLSSNGAAAQVVLGKVTGAGTLAVANAGITYLLNTSNDTTGILWAQSGTISLGTLSDASGNGNIKLGSGTTTGGLQWNVAATGALTLNNRSIELAGTTGGGTIDSSSLVAANSITINNNLLFTTVSSGAKILTLAGINQGINTFAGNILNNGSSATALTKSGMDFWILTGTGNNYTGALTINQGTLRVINASGLGGTGTFSFGGAANGQGLDIRSDAAPTGIRSINNNSATNAYIYVDHAAANGNATTGQTITFGTVAQANNTAGFTIVGNHGYGVVFGLNTLAASNTTAATLTTYTITNDLGSPGLNGYSVGANEFVSIAGFAESGSNTAGVTQTLNGWGNYTITGPISNTSTQPVNLTKSGSGVLTLSPTLLSGWNTGTLTLSGGTTRISSSIATGGATVTLGTSLVELRNNASTNFGFNVANVSGASTLFLDHSDTAGNTNANRMATIGSITGGASQTLNIVGDHGYGLTTGAVSVGAFTLTLGNYLNAVGYGAAGYTGGNVTLGNITSTGAGTLVLAGFGDYVLGGTLGVTSGSLSITKSNLGVVTFAGANSGWTSGTLTASGGTTLIDATNTNAVGSANLGGTAGLLEILSAAGTSGSSWTTKNLTVGGSFTLVADPLAGSNATGQTVQLGGFTGAAQTVIINSNHGYGITFNGAGTQGATTTVLTNAGNGLVTLAGGLTSTAATSTYTLGGPGDYNVSGNITAGTGSVALTKSGPGTTTLAGTNTIGGALTLSGGILRITNAGALGGTGTITAQGANTNSVGSMGFDLRNDTGMDLSGRVVTSGGYNYSINVDRALGGTGTNQTMTMSGGQWAGATGTSWGFTVTGANGYSLQYKGAAFTVIQGNAAPIINNFIASISGNGGIIFNSGITFTNTTTATGVNMSGTGDYLLSGALTSQSGTTSIATVTKNGTGTLTISGDNSSTWNSVVSDELITASAGILRLTNGGGLGGANAVYNQNGGVLDLRSDAGITQTGPVVTVGATSTINVDRAVGGTGTGGTQTITSLKDNGVFSVYTTGGTQSGGNAYNLGITTFTVGGIGTAVIPTLINSIGNGGALKIGTLAGAATFNVVVNGSGNTQVTNAMTANTGALTKSGTGTLTISGPAGYAASNTNGAVTVNGGTLALDFTGITTPTNLLQSAALTLGAANAGGVSGGTLTIKAAASGATSQTLTTLALAAGQDNITMIAGGASNTLTFSGAITATNAGSTALISAPASTTVSVATALNTAATTGRNLVFFDGTSYNWATNTTSGAAFISNTNASALAAVKYAPLLLTAGTDTSNSQVTATGTTTLGGARVTNSLMINTSGTGGTLALGGNLLTLTQGGLLFTDSTDYFITGTSATNGLKSAIATNSDLVINNYGGGTLYLQAPIIQGTGISTLTLGGIGTTILGNAAVLATVGTYTGITYINSGTVILASGIVGLGASNTALTQNGGTFDLNGNNVIIGSVNGGPAAVIDNNPLATTAASLTIGAGNGTGTFNGTIKDTKGALTIIKAGTGAITLGDAVTGGSNLFTGDLKFTGASTLTLNSLADSASSKVDFNVSGAVLKFVGRSNLTLSNRAFDISAANGSATIDSSSTAGSINGTNAVMTIGSAFAPTGSGALSLTLQGTAGNVANGGAGSGLGDGISGITGAGNVAVVNAFTGAIGNGTGGGTVALTIAGAGGWSLGGNNTYSGGTTISSTGLVRATSATAFGTGTVNVTGTGTLDLRSDLGLTFANAFTMNGSFTINVDRAIGGSGYGQIMNIGVVTEATSGKTLTVNNLTGATSQTGSGIIDGYGLHIAGLALTSGSATTIQNSMGSPGAAEFVIPTAGTGVAGALVIDGVTAAASLGVHTLTFGSAASNNFGVTVINGDITQGAGTTLGITVAGGGGNGQFITLAGQTAATNYSGGLTFNVGTGLATVRVTNANALGTGGVTFIGTAGAATLEVRSDTSLSFANNITLGNTTTARTNVLTVGEALNGSSGRSNSFTFGTIGFQGITANALTVAGIGGSADSSGNSVTFGGVVLGNNSLNGTATFTITNNLLQPGELNLGNVSSTNTTGGTTQTLTIAGVGVTTLGNVTDSAAATALTAINFTGTGVLDLSGVTSANNYSGGLTLTGGTTRVTNAFGLGASSNVVNFIGGQLELRSDSDATYSNQMLLNATGTGTLTVGQLPGGTGVNGATGVMFTLGQLKVGTSGKAFAVNGIGGSLATSADSVTLGGVDLNGFAVTTITNNLQLPGMLNVGNVSSSTAGTSVLTFNGSGVTLVGDVTNGSGTVGLAYTGTGILDLSRMTGATNYSGGLNINTSTAAALVRITNVLQLGAAAGISFGGGTLEIRSDTDFTYAGALNWNANTGNVNISIGEVGTGTTTGVGRTFNFGTLTVTTASGKTFAFGGIGNTGASSSDSIVVNNVTFGAGNLSNTIGNNLALPGTLSLGNITGNGTTGTVTLTISGSGFTTIGDVTNGSGGSVTALTYGGTGILQVTPTATSTTNYSGGLNVSGAGTLRIITNSTAANFGATTNTIAMTNGTLDIRTNSNLAVANTISVGTNSVTINVDAAAGGSLSNTVTFGGAVTTLTTTAKSLTLTSGSNYGINFTNGFSVVTSGASYTIANNASGTVNLGGIDFQAGTGTLTLGGTGYTIVGNVTGTAAAPLLVYSGTGFLDMTGITGGTNPFSALTLSGAGGIVRVGSASNLGSGAATVNFTSTTTAATLQVRSDGSGSNGSIAFGNGVVFNGAASALGIIDVGNNGGSSTGNTVAFGALTNSGSGNASTLTINGANGYGASFTSLALPSGTANVSTTLVANAPVAITGGVTNANTALVSTIADTLILDGVSTGSIGGAIADGTTAVTAVTKQGTGTWTFAGANTYTGATTVNNGTLLINGSSVAGSAYTVNGSATQGLQGMLGGTGTIGGAVTLGTNGASSFDLGAVINPGTAGGAGTLTISGLLTVNTYSTLSFDLGTANTVGAGVNDLISAALTPVINGNTQVIINTLGTLTMGAYTLINGYTGSIANAGNFTLAAFTGADTTHGGLLVNNNGSLQLIVTNATPTDAYWSGAVDGNWNSFNLGTSATNWRTDATSGTDTLALPGSNTNVHFNTTTPAAGNLVTTLGSNFAINTLSFDAAATSAVTINGGTLTIDPASSSTGITLENGAAAATINSAVVLGSAQTWTNNSATSLLTLGGSLTNGGYLLTKAGVGAVTTTGVISGAGGLALTGGALSINQQANTFTGNITVDGASTVLSIVGNSAGTYTTSNPLGNAVAGGTNFKTVTLTNGGTFSLASQNFNVNVITSTNVGAGQVFIIGTGGGRLDVAGGSTLTVDDGSTNGTATTAYELQGSGNMTKTGNGTLILRNQNSYSGTITVSAGLLQASGTTMATASGGIIVQSGGALNLAGQLLTDMEAVTISGTGLTASPAGAITNSTGTASYGGAITLAADSAVGGAGTLMTLSGVIDDAGGGYGLVKLGTGATTLSGTANTYTGTLSINGGTLTLASMADSGAGSNGTGAIVFNNAAAAATLTYTGSGSGSMTGRGISLLGSGGAVTINNNGTGALIFKGSNTNSISGNTLLTLGGSFVGADNVMTGNLTDNGASVLSITKSGASKWVLSGTNTYSGATTISAGTLQFTGATALASATAITLGGGTLSYLDDTAGAIDRTANVLTLTATSTIDVGNNGGATTGSVVRFGALTQLTAAARTLNFTSANGYSVELASLALSPGTGQTTTLSSTAVNISIVGNVTNGMSGFTTAQFDTLALASSTTGNSISGVISDAAGGSFLPLAGGYTKITQSGGGMWRLSGQNTNTGAVAVQNGAIWLAGGDNRLNPNGGGVTLGTGTTSGKLIIGGNADGTTTAGSQHSQTLNQINATSILATSGTGTLNGVVGGADGGTSAGTPANNSTLTLNIGSGLTDTYTGLIGWDGTGTLGFQNNINLVKSGGGTLVLSGDLSNWTGTGSGGSLAADATRPTITLSGGVLRLTSTTVINTVILNTGGLIDDQGFTLGPNGLIITTGGLITLNGTTDSFASAGITSASHGVVALNFNNGPTGVTGYEGSDMYLGAVGNRIFTSSGTFAAGAGGIYRLGGGAPWSQIGASTLGGSGGYLQVASANIITGANNVIIGDNGTYNGGTGIFGGSSTVEFTAGQNYTGTTTLAGGTLVVNSNPVGNPTTAAGSLILDGGILRYSGITTDFSSRLTIASGGTIDTNGQSVVFATALANSNTGTSGLSNGGLTKIGAGTLTLSKGNTFVGTTTAAQGSLSLDFNQSGAVTDDILNNAAAINLAGGTLVVNAKGSTNINNQRTVSTSLIYGGSTLNVTRTTAFSGSGAVNVGLGLINRSSGAGLNIVMGTGVTLGTTGNVTTTSRNAFTSILSPGITINSTDWATSAATQTTGVSWDGADAGGTNVITVSGSAPANGSLISFSGTVPGGLSATQAYYVVSSSGSTFKVAAALGGSAITLSNSGTSSGTYNTSGAITALGTYYTTTTGGTTASNYTGKDVDVTSSATLGGAITVNTLRFNTNTAFTLTLTGTNTLTSGGILVTSNVTNTNQIITGGTLASSAGELVINDFDATVANSLTISSIIDLSSVAGSGITKNGVGTVILGGANNYSGQTVINGGILQLTAANQYGTTTGFTLNGGTLTWNTAGVALPKLFTLGLNGGGLNSVGGGNSSIGTAGDVLSFIGLGARTLNLTTGVSDRRTDVLFNIGDNGGPTSLVIGSLSGANSQSVVRLSGSNSYTGTTTITLGVLELNNANALPGGVGGATLGTGNTGGGNLIFNGGTGTNRAILGLSTAVGDFTRALGTGFDQVQFLGSGGFGNISGGTTRVVKLADSTGGAVGGVITWGSTYFLPSGGQLEFGVSNTNVPEAGAIDFQNGLALGNAARIVDVQDNTQSANTSNVDAIISGALTTSGASGSLTKTGAGVLKLTADNSTGSNAASTMTVSAGYLVLSDLTALLGATGANRNVTVTSPGGVVLMGAAPGTAAFVSLLNRLTLTSTGSALIDTSNTSVLANVDLSLFSSLGFGAYSDIGGVPIYYGGTITPGSANYRIASPSVAAKGGQGVVGAAVQYAANLLVLTRANLFVDNGVTPRSVTYASGEFYLTGYNSYSGGTSIQGTGGGAAQIGIGNDAAFGTGLISASPTVAGGAYFGSLNGDHVLSNNITLGIAGNFVIAGNTASRGVANYGAMTYLGTINLPSTVSIYSEGLANAIVLGDLKPTGATTAVTFANNSSGIFNLLTTPAGAVVKSYTSSIILTGATVVIDSDRSLGVVPAAPATNITFSTGPSGVLKIQPGTGAVVLNVNRNIAITSNIASTYDVTGGTLSINGITTGNLSPNATLTIPGIISGGGTGVVTKSGLGTLILQGTNTFTATTAATGFLINAGTLQLDYANLQGAGPILNNTTTMTLNLGAAANGTLGNGGTLYLSNGSTAKTQNFSATTVNAKDNYITLDSTAAGGVTTLGLGAITRVVGGTLNFTGNANGLGQAVINASNAAGILAGATWGGSDLVATSGSVLSRYLGYTALTGNTIVSSTATNVKVDNGTSGNVTLAATGVININTLTFFDTAARTIDVRNGTTAGTLNFGTVGTILAGSGTGALTIGISGTAGTINAGGTTTTTSGELIFINNSASTMTVNSVIQNNTGTGAVTTVVKSGSGIVTFAGANTYTGSLYINNGILQYSDGSAAAKNLGSATVAATNIIMNGGALRYTGSTSNNLIFGMTYNSISAIDVLNSAGTVVAGTTTALSGMTGINGIAGILQKTGAGTLTLSGNVVNTNLSVEVVSSTLNLAKASTSAIFAVDQAGGGAALIVDSGAKAVLGGTGGNQISDTSSVVIKGTGLLDLNGLNEGFDGLGGNGIVTNNTTGTSTLTLGTNNDSNISANTLFAAAAGMASTGLNNFSGVIQDGGSGKVVALVKAGAGTQILSAQSTYSGGTTINSGTLKLGVTNALLQTGSVTILGSTIVNGLNVAGTFDLGGYNQTINDLNSSSGGYITNTVALTWNGSAWTATAGTNTLTVGNGDASSSFNGTLMDGLTIIPNPGTGADTSVAGVLALTKTGAGTLTLSGYNTASGVLTVNQGEVDLNNAATNASNNTWSGNVIVNATGILKLLQSNQILDSSTLAVTGGTFRLNGNMETVAGVSLTGGGFILDAIGGGALTSTTTFDLQSGTVSGILAGTVGVSKTTGGTVVLSGANTFTGKTSVTGGVLSISADNNLGAAPGSNVDDQLTLDGGTLQTTATLTIASTRRITVGGSGGTFDTAGTTTATINSVILGGGSINKIGAGTLVFTAANTYSGKTSIQQGAVSVGSINSVAGGAASSSLGAPVSVANGTIDMGAATTTGALVYTGAGETTDRVVNLAGTTGGGTLDQSGTGVVKFTSDLTATGAGSKVLTLQGSTAGTGEISGAIVDNSGANTTGVTKEGTGAWVLSGTNTYTGATTVNGGTLQVGASGAGSIGNSTVTVNSTATLSGSGTIAGGTVIASGGVLAPGDGDPSTGNATLTFSAAAASLTVADTGSIHLSLTTADSTDSGFATWFHANPGGTAADYVTSIGGIANTGSGTSWNDVHSGSHDFISAADTIALGSTNTADKRVVVSLNNLSGVSYGSVFNLMDWSTAGLTHDDSALSAMGAFSVANNLQLQDLSSLSAGLAWDTSLFDSYGILVVVPEPGRMLFLMLGLLGLLTRRRRRLVG